MVLNLSMQLSISDHSISDIMSPEFAAYYDQNQLAIKIPRLKYGRQILFKNKNITLISVRINQLHNRHIVL